MKIRFSPFCEHVVITQKLNSFKCKLTFGQIVKRWLASRASKNQTQ
ncbi:hypothetical protein SMU58_01094 [Streptococcus mutans A19]|nr:hypothetical protein SMU22_02137 [Streptococcus mutans 4SM1]EMB82032.1 hypothetical protein SMU52_04413 [Streptococcus mutans NFSM2]EMB92213.1 hypothetical protein SMU58_01094 [Streptococcus mutans A19]EMB95188.1 hypothetical protein SMU60_01844 [Streptococcus mutans U138]EMC46802.1 hypothetical protein SMU99_01774 [Streptococcus mutans 24]